MDTIQYGSDGIELDEYYEFDTEELCILYCHRTPPHLLLENYLLEYNPAWWQNKSRAYLYYPPSQVDL